MIKIATHNGSFHTDDVFAVATLEMYLAQEGQGDTEVIRTRDEKIIKEADYALDVGGIYDPDTGRFDHHQEDAPTPRENGVPYAAFGLVWREYGAKLCDDEAVAQAIDERLVQPIDGPDNGVFLAGPPDIEGVYPYFLGNAVNVFKPTWKEEPEVADERFLQLVEWAKVLLGREISVTKDVIDGEKLTKNAYETAEDKRLVYLEKKYPWKRVLKGLPDTVLVIYPDEANNQWRLHAVPDEDYSYSFAFPDEWRGKREGEFSEVVDMPEAVACHKSLPMLVTETREAAEILAQKVLED